MAQLQQQRVQRFTMALSPFDQTIPRIYVRKILCFPFPNNGRHAEAARHLRDGLDVTLARWPFIAGDVGPVPEAPTTTQDGTTAATTTTTTQRSRLELHYHMPVSCSLRPGLFVERRLSWAYKDLAERGMPPSRLLKEHLSQLPEHPLSSEFCPAFGLQANFINGGLLLCFSFHHAVFDGTTGRLFFQYFAAAMKQGWQIWLGPDDLSMNRLSHLPFDQTPAGQSPFKREWFPEYDFSNRPLPTASSNDFACNILTFAAPKLIILKMDVMAHIRKSGDTQSWVSTNDCLCALLWIAVVRSRCGRLATSDTVKFSFAVGLRARAAPALPPTYMGNAIAHVIAAAPVGELLDGGSPGIDPPRPGLGLAQPTIRVSVITRAALRIRAAIAAVDGAFVARRRALFASLPDPRLAQTAFRRALNMPTSGLDCSSWRDQIAGIDFGIPGAAPVPEFFRKTFSANEGSCNILPRTAREEDNTANWEVLLALSREDMDRICTGSELGGWALRIVT